MARAVRQVSYFIGLVFAAHESISRCRPREGTVRIPCLAAASPATRAGGKARKRNRMNNIPIEELQKRDNTFGALQMYDGDLRIFFNCEKGIANLTSRQQCGRRTCIRYRAIEGAQIAGSNLKFHPSARPKVEAIQARLASEVLAQRKASTDLEGRQLWNMLWVLCCAQHPLQRFCSLRATGCP